MNDEYWCRQCAVNGATRCVKSAGRRAVSWLYPLSVSEYHNAGASLPLPRPQPIRPAMGTQKARKKRALAREGTPSPPDPAEVLRSDPDLRRVAALTLKSIAGWSLTQIKKELCKKVSRTSLQRWAEKLCSNKTLKRKPRAKTYRLSEANVVATMMALQTPRGKRPGTALVQVARTLVATRVTPPAHRTTFARALHRENWSEQPVTAVIAMTQRHLDLRATFCRQFGRILSRIMMSTDSKIFPMIPDRSTRLGRAWAPKGSPMTCAVSAKSIAQVHAYGAITAFERGPLIEVTGTKNGAGAVPADLQGEIARPADASLAAAIAGVRQRPGQAAMPPKGVNCVEYRRRVLGGAGGFLAAGTTIFSRAGITAWSFQQDGASPHSVAATNNGRRTRQMIEQHARLVEPWPPKAADLSPIEKVWAHMEADIYSRDYATFQEFRAVVRDAWDRATTPSRLRALFGGIRRTYEVCAAKDGKQVSGWGKRAK